MPTSSSRTKKTAIIIIIIAKEEEVHPSQSTAEFRWKQGTSSI
jgi:hypothetical protein